MNDSFVPALSPSELKALLAQSNAQRAQWMLTDVAEHEEVWALEDANGWVIAKLIEPLPDGPRYALPIWPRQELAALEARDASEQPKAIDLESLLEDLLPEVQAQGWGILAFSVKDAGESFHTADFSNQLAAAWESLTEEN